MLIENLHSEARITFLLEFSNSTVIPLMFHLWQKAVHYLYALRAQVLSYQALHTLFICSQSCLHFSISLPKTNVGRFFVKLLVCFFQTSFFVDFRFPDSPQCEMMLFVLAYVFSISLKWRMICATKYNYLCRKDDS